MWGKYLSACFTEISQKRKLFLLDAGTRKLCVHVMIGKMVTEFFDWNN